MGGIGSGGKPKPTALKVLDGSLSPEKAKKHPNPAPVSTLPQPPDWLGAEGLAEWHRVVPELARLGLLTVVDVGNLTAYCMAWQTFVSSAKDVQARGVLVPGRDGDLVKNPSAQIMRDSATTMRGLAQDFGLTPSARARMVLPGEVEEASDIEALFSQPRRGTK